MTKGAQIGMSLFLLADAVLFFLLILAFVYFRGPDASHLPVRAPLIYTIILLISALSMWRASSGSRVWIAMTIGLAAIFFVGEIIESMALIRRGLTMSRSLFGTTFFALSGVYGLQLLIAMTTFALVPASGIRIVARYWYFLTGVWLAIFVITHIGSAQ
jgi:heme/copper-type cytochrome/quinol oxidase subunit 3